MNFPLTIWRQTLAETWRLFLITTAILVTIVSFTLTVKFFAEGRLGPLETLKFMLLAMVPMLQYTVPFAACFASTLAYHRMAADNEATAAHAGGISHRALLVPALVSGLALAGAMSLLTEQVVPRFLWSMEALVHRNIAKLVVSSIQRREPIEQGGVMLYADEVAPARPDREGGAEDAFVLFGVVVARSGHGAEPDFEATARRAAVQIYPGRGAPGAEPQGRASTLIVATLQDATLKDRTGLWQNAEYRHAFSIRGGVEDDPKFYTWSGLRALRRDPDRLGFVDRQRRDLAYHLGEREACAAIRRSLRSSGRAALAAPDGDVLIIEGRDIVYGPGARDRSRARWEILPGPSGAVVVERYSPGRPGVDAGGPRGAAPVLRMTARSGGLSTDMGDDPSTRRLAIILELEAVASSAGAAPIAGELAVQSFTGLSVEENPLDELMRLPSSALLARAEPRTTGPGADPFLIPPTRELASLLLRLQREITSKQHERMAMSAAGLVMILTGAVTALRLRASLPLTVYLWSFFPALGTVLSISAGQQMVEPLGNVGLAMLWAGVGALAVYSFAAYRIVRRH